MFHWKTCLGTMSRSFIVEGKEVVLKICGNLSVTSYWSEYSKSSDVFIVNWRTEKVSSLETEVQGCFEMSLEGYWHWYDSWEKKASDQATWRKKVHNAGKT